MILLSEEQWCGRWDLNPHRPCGPADFLTGHGFRRPAIRRFAVWTIPSPYSAILEVRRCPSSLYTFPAKNSVQAWLGIAIAGFPEFGQFYIAGFPASTQV